MFFIAKLLLVCTYVVWFTFKNGVNTLGEVLRTQIVFNFNEIGYAYQVLDQMPKQIHS